MKIKDWGKISAVCAVFLSPCLDTTFRYVWVEGVDSRDLNALDKTYNDRGTMFTLGINLMF